MRKKDNQSKIDPVCGIDLAGYPEVGRFNYQGQEFYFCSQACKEIFKKDPVKFQGTPLIKLANIKKSFNLGKAETKILKGLSFYVWRGDFIAIVGPSGSGKSTALNIIGLLDRPTGGKILLAGKDASLMSDDERAQLRSKMFGFVFQQYNLIPWLTAYENATLPLVFARQRADEKVVKNYFKELGLGSRLRHRPFEMSGGEQQRTALLRALINDPEIILGDEPTGNLDSVTGDKILKMLIDLNREHGKTLVIVTHDNHIAEKADRIIAIKDGQLIPATELHKNIHTR